MLGNLYKEIVLIDLTLQLNQSNTGTIYKTKGILINEFP